MAYHHGDLRRTLLAEAATAISEAGASAVSLRGLARQAGVSNAAPTHHFGDKAGLLTALAAEGYDMLADAVTEARLSGGGLIEMGAAYVRFALDHPAHFEVMFHPGLYRAGDGELLSAQRRASEALAAGVADSRPDSGVRATRDAPQEAGQGGESATGGRADEADGAGEADLAAVAAWSLVHGYATLVLTGAVRAHDPRTQARAIARFLSPEGRSSR